jgi:hypothetical protein
VRFLFGNSGATSGSWAVCALHTLPRLVKLNPCENQGQGNRSNRTCTGDTDNHSEFAAGQPALH